MMLYTKISMKSANRSWKEDFYKYLYVYENGSHLGHVTSIILVNFISLYPQNYIQNLVENAPVVSEKSEIKFVIRK